MPFGSEKTRFAATIRFASRFSGRDPVCAVSRNVLFPPEEHPFQFVAPVAERDEAGEPLAAAQLRVVVVPAAELAVASQYIGIGGHGAGDAAQVVQALARGERTGAEVHAVDVDELEAVAAAAVGPPLRVAVVEVFVFDAGPVHLGCESCKGIQYREGMRSGEGVGDLREGAEVRIAGHEVGFAQQAAGVVFAPADRLGGRDVPLAELHAVLEGAAGLALAQVSVKKGVEA